MIVDPLFYATAVPAVAIVGLSKSGFGGGAALIAVPLMSLAVPPLQAAGIMLPILCVMDAMGLLAYRGRVDWPMVRLLLPAALVGTAIGWATATSVTDAHVRLMVGVIAIAFVGFRLIDRRSGGGAAPPNRLAGSFWGAVSGFTSFISHAGGPPMQIYMLPRKLEPQLFAGTSIVIFAAINASKLVPYFMLGQFDTQNLTTSLALFPLALVSMALGIWLVRVISAALFYRIAYTTILVVGVKLVWDGVAGLL